VPVFAANATRAHPPGTPLFVNVTMILELVYTPAGVPDMGMSGMGGGNDLDVYPHIMLHSFQVTATDLQDPGTAKPTTNFGGYTVTTQFTFSLPIIFED
jgi:hypothetical protein